MHDLFILPGPVFPFPAMVKVTRAYGTSAVARRQDNQLVEQTETGAEHLHAVLDAAVTGLGAPVLVCRGCGHQVQVGAAHFEVFEHVPTREDDLFALNPSRARRPTTVTLRRLAVGHSGQPRTSRRHTLTGSP